MRTCALLYAKFVAKCSVAGCERPRKSSIASARRSPVRAPSPQRPRTMSFGYLRLRLRRRSDAKAQLRPRTSEATLRAPMEGYLFEPFREPVRGARPVSCLSSTTAQTFYTARAGTLSSGPRPRPMVIMPDSRPMSMTSFQSTYTYTADAGVSSEEGGGGTRTSVVFEDEERALRQLGERHSAYSFCGDKLLTIWIKFCHLFPRIAIASWVIRLPRIAINRRRAAPYGTRPWPAFGAHRASCHRTRHGTGPPVLLLSPLPHCRPRRRRPPRAAHSMPHTRTHDAARPTKAVVTSAASGTPFSTSTSTSHKAHPPTRPPPLPSTNMRDSSGSTSTSATASSSGAATSAATSTNSCTSGGWRSSVGSTPPTSPGDSDASGCHGLPPSNHYESYFAHDVQKSEEEPAERRRAQSEHGRGPTGPTMPKKSKLLKKRPATVSVSGAEALGRGESKLRLESAPAPGPSRAKSILGIKIGPSREKTREREGRLASVAEWTEGVEYLPQVRPPSPLWAGSSGMVRRFPPVFVFPADAVLLPSYQARTPGSPFPRAAYPTPTSTT